MIQPCFVMIICSIPILFLFPLCCLIHSEFVIFVFSRDKVTKSVCPSVGPSVRQYVCHAFAFRPSRSDVCRVYTALFLGKKS